MGELSQSSLAQELSVDAGRYARAMTLPMSPAVAVELALAYHLILETLHKGGGNESHLASMMKLTFTTMLVSNSTGLKVRAQVFREAREGIVRCRRSGRNTGKWNLDQTTYKRLCEVVAAFDRQLKQAPFYEFMLADEEMTALLAR